MAVSTRPSAVADGDFVVTASPIHHSAGSAATAPKMMAMMAAAPPASTAFESMLDVFDAAAGLMVRRVPQTTVVTPVVDVTYLLESYKVNLWDPEAGRANAWKGQGKEFFFGLQADHTIDDESPYAFAPKDDSVKTTSADHMDRSSVLEHPDALVMMKRTYCCSPAQIFMHHSTDGRIARVAQESRCCKTKAVGVYAASSAADPADPSGADIHAEIGSSQKSDGEKWYTVSGPVWQPGCYCCCVSHAMRCGECRYVRLHIYSGADTELSKPVGELNRVMPGCCNPVALDGDDFTLTFPMGANKLQRASLLAAAVMLDQTAFYDKRPRIVCCVDDGDSDDDDG